MKKLTSEIIRLILCFTIFLSLFLPKSYCMTNSIEEAVNSLSTDLMAYLNVTEDHQVKIAFLPISMDRHNQSVLARVTFEIMRTKLSEIKGISLVDRDLSLRTMAELKIVLDKGLLKPDDVIKFAKQTEIDYLITGHITDLNTIINLNLFIWKISDGSLLSIKSVQIRKSAEIISLLSSEDKIENIEPYSVKWQSKTLPYHVLALSIDDINGDGIDELILVTEDELKTLVWDGFCFVERSSVSYVDIAKVRRNQSELRIINKDQAQNNIYISIPEIETSIWRYDKDNLVRSGELPFNLIYAYGDYMIVGALKDDRNYFSGQKTYLVKTSDRTRVEKPIPKDFYSIAVADVNSDGNTEWIIVDNDNVLRIYSEDMSLIWKSPVLFGAGLIIYDLDNNGKQEIILTSAVPQGKNDSLIIFEWNGVDYVKKWESQPISGSISAMCIGDPNLDGINELVIAVYTQEGTKIEFYTPN